MLFLVTILTLSQSIAKCNYAQFRLILDLAIAQSKEVTDRPSKVQMDMKIDIITASLKMMTSKHNRYGVEACSQIFGLKEVGFMTC